MTDTTDDPDQDYDIEWRWCETHMSWYDPHWACPKCEDGEPPFAATIKNIFPGKRGTKP